MADAGDNQRRSDEKESISTEETKVNKKLNKNLLCSLQWIIMMKPDRYEFLRRMKTWDLEETTQVIMYTTRDTKRY